MIVPMSKVFVVTQSRKSDRLLDVLGQLGVIHIEPVDPERAVADEQTLEQLAEYNQAIRILQGIKANGALEDMQPLHLAQETILLYKSLAEEREQLNTLLRQADQLAIWGNLEIGTLHALRETGVPLQFFQVLQKNLAEFQELPADCLEILGDPSAPKVLVAVIDRSSQFSAPPEAECLNWPARDLPSIKAEAADLERSIQQNNERLAVLAQGLDSLEQARQRNDAHAATCVALRSGISHSSLYALQGWVPSAKAEDLNDRLEELGISAAVDVIEPAEDEAPPTLIEYPSWAKPIKALFDMLGTLPGYDEIDLSPFFMVGLPLFTAMLIGDAGYGLILALAGLLFYPKIKRSAGPPAAHLLLIFGLATLVWGVLTANFFGVTPTSLAAAGYAGAADTMRAVAPLWRDDAEAGRTLIMKISLLIGCLHLVAAHVRRVVELYPDVRAYAEIGWSVILADMMAIIWFVMFPESGSMPSFLGIILLLGILTVSWFGEPQANPIKRALTGFAAAILPLLGTFSDIMSYIRLFAVGLASYYIADAFNGLGAQVAQSPAGWLAGAPIVIFGHVLNIGLAGIAIFAHGVRLNMLEFSNNVGVKWAGYAYRPFTKDVKATIGESEL